MPANPYRGALRRSGQTRATQLHFERLLLNAAFLKEESPLDYDVQALVPAAWDTLEQDIDVFEKRVKVTLMLDDSVAKFYRAMGRGYQGRINRILATFAQMRIAQIKRLEEMLAEELAQVEEKRR